VPRQPAVIFGLVGIEIVQNHMDLAAGMFGRQAVHEIEELDTPAALIMAGLDQASGNVEGGETGSWSHHNGRLSCPLTYATGY
jgi:hypothetical protein